MNGEEQRLLIEQAMLAPSVHNVQPARWRIEGDSVVLFEDLSRRLPFGDPRGGDAAISLGAAAEGLRLAASRMGWSVVAHDGALPVSTGDLRPIARYGFREGALAEPLADVVEARRSWRGNFLKPTEPDRTAAAALASEDAVVIVDKDRLVEVARLFDVASYGFMRDDRFRGELLSWMRLSRGHPRWSSDGLNADAMAMSRIEAVGAGMVLGPAFRTLHKLGAAAALLAEGGKVSGGAAVVVLHRPKDEAPFLSGAVFYRTWLAIEAAGFGAAVLAALADDAHAASRVREVVELPAERRIVSAFRIGRRLSGRPALRARCAVEEVLV